MMERFMIDNATKLNAAELCNGLYNIQIQSREDAETQKDDFTAIQPVILKC
jgi:hypothetical protein